MLANMIKRLGVKLNLNDPRWGQKPDGDKDGRRPQQGDGPPDLDQLWRDFNARLARMFGQKGPGGPTSGGTGGDMKGAGAMAGIVVVIALLIWLASGSFIVQEGQKAVVTTFGRLSHTAGSGFNWRWPYPIQGHEIVNVSQVRNVEVGYRGSVRSKQPREALMLTDDQNIIDIQFAVQYTLKDPVSWLYNNRVPEDNIRQVAETAMREIVGRSKMDFVLYEGRERVARDVHVLMQQILDKYASGAHINNVSMQAVQPPEQVQGAFDDALKAGQDRQRATNEGQAYANTVIPEARGKAIRLMQEAEAYRSMVTENATGNASRFNQVVAEYAKAPVVTRDRMYLETMQQVFTSTSKVMVDAKSGSNLLYLPLDKLMAQAAATDAAARTTAAPVPPTTAQQEIMQTIETVQQRSNRSRDSSRDRESR
ncbi:FtsH protease activity modulator HflK [Pseudoduganella sp. GCM10020061]|uniref:FtsH protease activity modulator HflK n=1 Tax=Pseudoduganella sp. GCM10020061 TaxID=3317345 RepID=UPI003624D4A5